ncbi:MAG: CDP-alcohol phosphatidyltransferase family protein [Candidatus Margulisbacteria bacterium]|jgi:phosphatidylglycerophosphate synthase|nr:CDP-alcohol phosphatidyltransferase family protein [Candidatus Margulisiibacteriota bacterium]
MLKSIAKMDKFIMSLNISMFRLRDRRGLKTYEKKFLWLINFFRWFHCTPNFLTALAVWGALLGGGFVLYGRRLEAVGCFFLAWFFTYFDGIYARQTGTESVFGRFWNALANTLCDILLFVPLLLSLIFADSYFLVGVLLSALVWRGLTLFVWQQAEILKLKTPRLFFRRAEFWLIFGVCLLLDWLPVAIIVNALLLLGALLYLLCQVCQALRSGAAPKSPARAALKSKKKNKIKSKK